MQHYWFMLVRVLLDARMTGPTSLCISTFITIAVYSSVHYIYNIIKGLVVFVSGEERFISHIHGGILLLKRVYYRLQTLDNAILLLDSFFADSQELLHLKIFIL